MTVDHPDGTDTKISKTGNLRVSDMLANVLVVPDYNVHFLCVHKLTQDRRLGVYFD